MDRGKLELLDVLNNSVKDLQQGIDMHCCLIDSLVNGKMNGERLQPLIDQCPKRTREIQLEKAITEAIEVLEASRKAFKSKQLELLRKKLMRTLIESD